MKNLIAIAFSLAFAQTDVLVPTTQRILTHREQAVLVRSWIEKRFDVSFRS
jgi:hypothetical protein